MERLLLHHCCAPCSPHVLTNLSEEYEVQSFWFNPNIQPNDELDKRKKALESYLKSLQRCLLSSPDSTDTEIWSSGKDCAERCRLCYAIRLGKTAEEAKKNNARYFSTTLLSSPHQKHEEIKKIGSEIANKDNLVFVYKDFRPLYYEGKNKVKEMGLYSQVYCGCLPSLAEKGKK